MLEDLGCEGEVIEMGMNLLGELEWKLIGLFRWGEVEVEDFWGVGNGDWVNEERKKGDEE